MTVRSSWMMAAAGALVALLALSSPGVAGEKGPGGGTGGTLGLGLDASCCWLDTHALQCVLEDIDASLGYTRPRPPEALVMNLADRLFDIYRGPFMAGEGDHPRYATAREHLARCPRLVPSSARTTNPCGCSPRHPGA